MQGSGTMDFGRVLEGVMQDFEGLWICEEFGMDSGLWILEGPGREVGWILVSFEKSLESDYSREF